MTNKHIISFNEHRQTNPPILRSGVGERVMDYCKLIDNGDLDTAKEYLKVWMGNTPNAKRNLIFTLEFYKRGKNIIDTTKRLLDEI